MACQLWSARQSSLLLLHHALVAELVEVHVLPLLLRDVPSAHERTSSPTHHESCGPGAPSWAASAAHGGQHRGHVGLRRGGNHPDDLRNHGKETGRVPVATVLGMAVVVEAD